MAANPSGTKEISLFAIARSDSISGISMSAEYDRGGAVK